MPTLKSPRSGCDSVRSIVFFAVVLSAFGLHCRWVSAQAVQPGPAQEPTAPVGPPSYRELDVDLDLIKLRNRVMQTLRQGFGNPLPQAEFDRFYLRYALARWSLEKNHALLAGFREELQIYLRNGRNAEVHDHLNNLVLGFMGNLAKPNPQDGDFRPASRVNAMLMIGELNTVEAARTSDIPVPLPEALPVLVTTVQDAQQLDAVKVAAVVGILRHAKLGGIKTPAARDQIRDVMLDLANSAKPPERSAAGHGWMRGQAAEVLGRLGAVGDGGAVAKQLAAMIADSSLLFSARCIAAKAMGELDYRGAAGLNPSQLAAPMGQLALDACAAELQAETIHRRQLKSRLNAASLGLDGLAGVAAEPPHKAFVNALQQSIKALLDAVGNTKLEDYELASQIEAQRVKIENILKPKP